MRTRLSAARDRPEGVRVFWFAEPSEQSHEPGSTSTKAGRILVVDDEKTIRLICRLNLQVAGFDTLEAEDGAAALELALAEHPDLILLDIMLPQVDGWEVAEQLASDEETREIPILFLSARSEPADQNRAYELGGVGFITKPFEPSVLTETVLEAVERTRRGERESMRDEWASSLSGR